MAKRAPQHYSEWALPLIGSICLIGGGLWLADTIAQLNQRTTPARTPANQTADSSGKNRDRNTALNPVAITLPHQFSAAKPIPTGYRKIAGEALYVTLIDLNDPAVFLGIGLAHNAPQANNSKVSKGDERFLHLVRRNKAAITVSGTFFSMDNQKRVMGNMISGGRFLKYSPWENYGTTLGLKAGNRPEMVTARIDGKPKWQNHWFSITAGPRLLRSGKVMVKPQAEGFTDRSMIDGKALRVAIGYPQHGRTLMLVTFLSPITLGKEAQIMKHLGTHEAMNLDGGTSVGLAQGGKILQPAGRELTNVITVYDVEYPAPDHLRQSWRSFQQGNTVAQVNQ
jgi:hypothetical protein